MKVIYTPPLYYRPVKYAVDLATKGGYTKEVAANLSIYRFAFYGKNKRKRLKDFSTKQFIHFYNLALEHPEAVIKPNYVNTQKR